jgi:hypothetical protein
METIYSALYGSRDTETVVLKHERRLKDHPTPARKSAPTLPLQGRVKSVPGKG